ncbi:MAG: glycosyltransferase family 2 protein, partial [Eubacteriales bacterium]|nr:glycosyltransferase family 2 protein [Eubacteriales bacterium]
MKLSIVIPVYNTRDYLAACLDSVLVPAADDCEIIVVNDGSTDDSEVLALDYAARYPGRIRVISTENGGLGAARNVGLEAASGEFVFFLDSDDRLADGALPEILDSLTPERDIVIFDFLSVDTDGNVLERLSGCRQTGAVSLHAFPELLMEYPSGCNKICRRSLFLDSGIRFPGRVWYEDLRTMPKLYPLTDRIWS